MKRVDDPASGGAIRTLLGRKCRFPLWEPKAFGLHKPLERDAALAEYGPSIKRAWTYKALNRLIQGSAADQTKAAMLATHKAGFRMMLQLHDELVFSVDKKEDAIEASEIMKSAVSLAVPSKVDVEVSKVEIVQGHNNQFVSWASWHRGEYASHERTLLAPS